MYVELHAASAFSFLQGASLPETLVERAAALGYSAIALLDADGVYGAPRFYKAAARAGLRAIVGAELTIEASAFGVHQAGGQVTARATQESGVDLDTCGGCRCSSPLPRATGISAAW
jgi:DNA polymerase III alpha subunit